MSESKETRRGLFDRRELMKYGAFLGTIAAGAAGAGGADAAETKIIHVNEASRLKRSPKKYTMKKSINLWAFPYPDRMGLGECFELAKRAGFDAVEVNFNLEGDLSPQSSEQDLKRIRAMAERAGIAISGVCTFLYWPYPFSANDEAVRTDAISLARKMIWTAHHLGTDNLLVVAGAVCIPWIKDAEKVSFTDCDKRTRAAVGALIPDAEKHGVSLNIENIFVNGYLMSPTDMIEFVDSFDHPLVNVHFDTGNIMQFQYPEDWIGLLGKRIKNTHLKEFTKKGTDYTLEGFRPLLDGTTDWPAVMEAFQSIGYEGYLTFEYFHPYAHYPEALAYHTSDALDRLLGRAEA